MAFPDFKPTLTRFKSEEIYVGSNRGIALG